MVSYCLCIDIITVIHLYQDYHKSSTLSVTTSLPSSEVFGNSGSTAEQVSPQRLKLLTETQDGTERLAMFIQTWVQLLDIQQGLLIHKFQELLGLFRYLREQIGMNNKVTTFTEIEEWVRRAVWYLVLVGIPVVQQACRDQKGVVLMAVLAVVPAAVVANLCLSTGKSNRTLTP